MTGSVVGGLSVVLGGIGAILSRQWPTASFAVAATAFVLAIWALGLVLDRDD